MTVRARILSDDLLRPIFKGRLLLYGLGVLIAIILAVTGNDHGALLPVTIVTAAIAAYQVRVISIPVAWVVDLTFAVGIALLSVTPTGLAIIIGWAAVMGIFDVNHRWFYPLGSGLAAAAATSQIEPGGFDWSTPATLRAVGVGAVGVFFVLVFRRVGDLLRQKEEEARSFFDRVPIALVRTSPAGELLEYNRATRKMFHKPVAGEDVTKRYVDAAQRKAFVQKMLNDGFVLDHEVTFQTKPGETIEAVIAANAVDDEAGELRYIESAIYDFTSLRRTEVERERLARVIESTSDLVSIGNFDGSLRYANAAARAWMLEHVTDDQYDHLGQTVSREDYVVMRDALRSDKDWSGVVVVPGRDGDRTVSVSLQVLEMGGDYSVASISRDVTHEVETQRQLKELLRAKDELVASISHEIRTPLSVVLGMASELRDNYLEFDAGTHQEFAMLIAEQGQEMANIVEDLLVAARADTGSIVLVADTLDLADEVESALRSLPELERSGTFENRAKALCWADPNRVRQILRNLIVNAQRYGGEQIVVATREVDGTVFVDVVDNGPGVTATAALTIFEPFERAHAEGSQPGSIGLGLTVSRDLARHMGGDLEYRRSDGQTIFSLSLPAEAP